MVEVSKYVARHICGESVQGLVRGVHFRKAISLLADGLQLIHRQAQSNGLVEYIKMGQRRWGMSIINSRFVALLLLLLVLLALQCCRPVGKNSFRHWQFTIRCKTTGSLP